MHHAQLMGTERDVLQRMRIQHTSGLGQQVARRRRVSAARGTQNPLTKYLNWIGICSKMFAKCRGISGAQMKQVKGYQINQMGSDWKIKLTRISAKHQVYSQLRKKQRYYRTLE